MTERNIAAIEQHQCPVCLRMHDTGNLLLDQRLDRGFKDKHVFTGHSFCPEHQKLSDDGYIAMVELQREPQRGEDPLSVPRTGAIAHVKEEAWPNIFSVPAPASRMCVVEVGVIDKLKGAMPKEEAANAS